MSGRRPRVWTETMQRRGMQELVAGATYAAIGRLLNVSEGTVKYHLSEREAARRRANALRAAARRRAARGPARPPLEPSQTVTVRLRGAPLQRLLQLAQRRRLKRATVARLLLEQALEREHLADFINL